MSSLKDLPSSLELIAMHKLENTHDWSSAWSAALCMRDPGAVSTGGAAQKFPSRCMALHRESSQLGQTFPHYFIQ